MGIVKNIQSDNIFYDKSLAIERARKLLLENEKTEAPAIPELITNIA